MKKSRAKRSGMIIPDCKSFNGYKPCYSGVNCLDECADPKPRGTRILIINLEAMGNVLVTTSLLPSVKRKYPASSIGWLTRKNAAPLLDNIPAIDRVYIWTPENLLVLQSMSFDLIMNLDKSVQSCALAMSLKGRKKLGYGLDPSGVIVPLNKEAEYNYRLGLDDHLKFQVNQKPNSQLLTEAMGLTYRRDEYILRLTNDEVAFSNQYRREIGVGDDEIVIGYNTGCSLLYPNKKLSVSQLVILVNEISKRQGLRQVLLGGPEDTERNAEISRAVGNKAIATPTTEGLRRGICYENICDLVITGDSLGMHIAIGLKKYVVVWFGVSCPQEIDLYGRGVKLIPEGLACSPCWKRECPYGLECIQMVDLERIVREVDNFAAASRAGRHPAT